MKLYGGSLEKVDIDSLFLDQASYLTLIDMPGFRFDAVFSTLP